LGKSKTDSYNWFLLISEQTKHTIRRKW
jgi:hypothetical protein